jgi:hypothetical protein
MKIVSQLSEMKLSFCEPAMRMKLLTIFNNNNNNNNNNNLRRKHNHSLQKFRVRNKISLESTTSKHPKTKIKKSKWMHNSQT